MTDSPSTVVMRVVLWPTRGEMATSERPLDDANAEERQFFGAQYADVPLLELWRRLRRAEWDAAERQRRITQLEDQARRMPPLHLIQEVNARHKRIRALLDTPDRRAISREALRDALATPESQYPATPDTEA
jgi:hypothetical protein